jgi:excisionase family DNA binding protein
VTAQKITADRLLTSHEVGDLLQVNPSSVKKWVNEGRIAAFRTPGGHRRIRVADLVAFLDLHKMPIPSSLLRQGRRRRRLLVVDDDAVHLRTIERRLKPYAARVAVETVENGIDALVRVGEWKPHLIVIDVYMPDLDGLEVCRRLKQRLATRNMDIIITSAHLTPQVVADARAAGAVACLPKPIDLQALLGRLGMANEVRA